MKGIRTLFVLILVGFVNIHPVVSQVEIIRKLPSSGIQQGIATWREPYPDPDVVLETGRTDFSGRISVGGQGGHNQAGDALYNVASDSILTLIQPLGENALLSFDATIVRLQSSIKEDQNYDGTLSLEFERMQFKTSGGFKQTLSETADVNSEDTDAKFSAAVSSGLIETLPMSLDYQSTWIEREDDTIQTESGRRDELTFKTAGTLGETGVELDADLEYEEDWEEKSENFGTTGNLKISVPFGQNFALKMKTVPIYSRSKTTVSELKSTSIETGVGVSWILNEELQTGVEGGRIDAWSDGSGTEYNSYQSSWKGGLGIDYLPSEGFFTGPSYTYAKAAGGNRTHDLLLPLGWCGLGRLKEISAKGMSTLIRADAGDRVKDAVDWMLNTTFVPADNMNLNSDYQGGYLWQEGEESWNHKMTVDFSHYPDPNLKYHGAYKLSNNQEDQAEDLWEQQYLVGMTVKPVISYKIYTVEVSETLDTSNGSTGDDALSSTVLKVSFPIGSELSTRFSFEWEWINRTSIGGDPGNYLHYSAGLSLAGKQIPFSLTADYALAYGYRGFRNDISSGIKVPLKKGYSIDSNFTLSSYEENDQNQLHWLLGLNLVYEF